MWNKSGLHCTWLIFGRMSLTIVTQMHIVEASGRTVSNLQPLLLNQAPNNDKEYPILKIHTTVAMLLNIQTIALMLATLPGSIVAAGCNAQQGQRPCPFPTGPACFDSTSSWGMCNGSCAQPVRVADGTWCSGKGAIIAVGTASSTQGAVLPPSPTQSNYTSIHIILFTKDKSHSPLHS
jgi:hypothetical protein